MSAVSLMRFLTRERIGFKVVAMDRQTKHSPPRMTRWWRIWRGGHVRAVVDFQHKVTFTTHPYWHARLLVGHRSVEFQNGPRGTKTRP